MADEYKKKFAGSVPKKKNLEWDLDFFLGTIMFTNIYGWKHQGKRWNDTLIVCRFTIIC